MNHIVAVAIVCFNLYVTAYICQVYNHADKLG